jgi:hypothetical protein
MRNPILENQIALMLLEFERDYNESFDNLTTSDRQTFIDSKALEIIQRVKNSV